MSILGYLSGRKLLIVLFAVVTLLYGTVLDTQDSAAWVASNGLYAAAVCWFLFTVYLAIDYAIKNRHCSVLRNVPRTQELDWVNSLPAPQDAGQRVYHELLRRLYSDANEKLAEYQLKSQEDLEFITMWVHEIKTPIAASKLIIENSLNEPTENALYCIEDEIGKMEDLVQMTLYYSRAGDFARDYIIASCSLGKIVKDCVKREYSSITNKKLTLRFSDLDFAVNTDEKWLGFIIKQVLDNAVKYSSPGGVIRIYAEHTKSERILHIEDNGAGIPAEDLRRIFDKNFTGSNGRNFQSATGMGLYLSQKLARKLGHFITAASVFGNGTLVSVHFPIWNDFFDG